MRHSLKTALMAGAMALTAFAAQAQVKIGVVNSASGPVSSIGIPYNKGIAAAMVNGGVVDGQKLTVVTIDDTSDPAVAARATRKLIEEDHVDVIMGSAGTPASLAMYAVAAEMKTPMVFLANGGVPGDKGVWEVTVPQPPPLMIDADIELMQKAGIKTVGYIGYNDAWGDLVYNSLKAAADKAGIQIVANERFARADTSVTPQVLKIMALHPDAILTGGSGSPGALPHIAFTERGYKGAQYSTHAIINSEFVRVGGPAVEGLVAPTGPVVVAEQLPDGNPIKKVALQFRADYQKANGSPSTDAFAAYGYDGMLIAADAAKRVAAKGVAPGTAEYRVALREALASTHELVGTHAVYSFTPASRWGTDERSRVMVKLDHGAWKLVPGS